MFLTLIQNLLEGARGLLKKPHKLKDSRDQGLVVTDAEAEHQAYQEGKREHSGG